MFEKFNENINRLHRAKKLSEYEYSQLVCLMNIMKSLDGIKNNLSDVSNHLSEIKQDINLGVRDLRSKDFK